MTKKLFIIIAALMPLCLKAQLGVGSWQVYPIFQNADKMIETPDKIYCLTAGFLMSYNPQTDETYNYGVDNVLTESSISNIYYNPKGKYLVLTYPTGNIDVIFDSGKSVNLPDIRDAVLVSTRVINDVAFSNGKMAVATNFGLVIYDDKRFEVIQSGIYDENIARVGMTDEYVAIHVPSKNQFGFIKQNERINYLNNFNFVSTTGSNVCYGLNGLSGSKFLFTNNSNTYVMDYDGANATLTAANPGFVATSKDNSIFENANGCYLYSGNKILECTPEGVFTSKNIPSALTNKTLAYWDDMNEIWIGDSDGLGRYDISSGAATETYPKFKNESLSCAKVGYLKFSPSGKLYVSQRGISELFRGDWPGGVRSYINMLDNSGIKDVTGFAVNDTYKVLEDPNDPDAYFVPSFKEGVHKVRYDRATGTYRKVLTYDKNNSTVVEFNPGFGQHLCHNIDFDGKGNLWVLNRQLQGKGVNMLPSRFVSADESSAENWITVCEGAVNNKNKVMQSVGDGQLLACKKSNMVYITFKDLQGIYVIDNKGTETNTDDQYRVWNEMIDQDGKLVSFYNHQLYSLFEDSKGRVWIGHDDGVFMIPNPSDATKDSFKIHRIKVPRNDGTNFADYLLPSESVICIEEDNSGRKWIGTLNAGAYLVSEDGTQIIETFNTNNSYLPYNSVYSIACDPNSNAVYFGTVGGLVKYNSSSAPAASDFSDVYAYPNPVRPEYTGWITIKGLMDKSLVKIANAAGEVFHTDVSEGGMITWDGCDKSGQRVKTGVYYVLASKSDDSSSVASVVTKILVVQ